MFDALSNRLHDVFRRLRGLGHLSEANMRDSLRDIRLALLEADVHVNVARDLLARVQERALGQEVLRSVTPGQQLVRIVHEELSAVLGGEHEPLRSAAQPPTVILLAGLQGSGKTTTAAKLGRRLVAQGHVPLLVPADLARPAAIEQLRRVGESAGLSVHPTAPGSTPVAAAREGVAAARARGHDVVIVDSAGRLHVDEALMAELVAVRDAVRPHEILYVADAMTGQDAVRSAAAFAETLGLTGAILTKLDGDARGGAALSIRAVTGVPIRFAGTGEKVEDLEPFHPGRLASRILGMGDVLTLVERAQALADEDEDRRLAAKVGGRERLTLDDLRQQLTRMQKLGSLDQILALLPGASRLPAGAVDEGEMGRMRAILDSMTHEERRDHTLLDGSRRRRIARGSGTSVQDVNRLLKQFVTMQKLMKQAGGPQAARRMFSGR